MKRILCLLWMGLLLCSLIAGCGHQHSWQEASCLSPKTCDRCGATEGQALGHSWSDATCTDPKTCNACGATEGQALGHSWSDATCTDPKTCNACGATQGDASGHNYGPWGVPQQDADGHWVYRSYCMVCEDMQAKPAQAPAVRTDLGSAGELNGTTLFISIFAEDVKTSWDPESSADQDTLALMDRHLEAGVQWLVEQVSAYGVTPRFIYDWEENPELCFRYDFGEELLVRADGGGYRTQANYILESIPTQALKEKYQAQNVIYFFYFNTDETNTVNSWSLSDQSGVDTEIVNVFVRDDYPDGFYYMPAASFAHEIMHCFGAVDLYYPSETITQAYVDHCAATGSNDIMYTVGLGDTVTQELTQLDAYYMGLTDSCEDVEAFGLGESTHAE